MRPILETKGSWQRIFVIVMSLLDKKAYSPVSLQQQTNKQTSRKSKNCVVNLLCFPSNVLGSNFFGANLDPDPGHFLYPDPDSIRIQEIWKKILTFELLDGFSNFKKVNHSKLCQEFIEIIRLMDPHMDPSFFGSGSGSSQKASDPQIQIRIWT